MAIIIELILNYFVGFDFREIGKRIYSRKIYIIFSINIKNLNSFTFFIIEETHFYVGKFKLERKKVG